MKYRGRKRDIKSGVDMTPMLDVVFQLIIFFLVSTTFAVLPGIKVQLPDSTTSENTSTMGITITAEKSGSLHFNDVSVDFEGLAEQLSKFDTKEIKKEEFPVTIEADSDVTNGTIVHLFDVIRQNGFAAVSLRTTNR